MYPSEYPHGLALRNFPCPSATQNSSPWSCKYCLQLLSAFHLYSLLRRPPRPRVELFDLNPAMSKKPDQLLQLDPKCHTECCRVRGAPVVAVRGCVDERQV